MVIGLNGRIPLNTAGNLAGRTARADRPGTAPTRQLLCRPDPRRPPGQLGQRDRPDVRASERFRPDTDIDPLAPLRPRRSSRTGDQRRRFLLPRSQADRPRRLTPADNAGIDVRLTQLRNLLAGHAAAPSARRPATNGTRTRRLSGRHGGSAGHPHAQRHGGRHRLAFRRHLLMRTTPDANGCRTSIRTTPPVAGRWGEAQSIPGEIPFRTPPPATAGRCRCTSTWSGSITPIRSAPAIRSTSTTSSTACRRTRRDDNCNTYDPFPLRQVTRRAIHGDVRRRDRRPRLLRCRRGACCFPPSGCGGWITPGRHQRHWPASTTWNPGEADSQSRAGRDGAGGVQQLFPAAGVARRDRHQLHVCDTDRRRRLSRQPTTAGAMDGPSSVSATTPTSTRTATTRPASRATSAAGISLICPT